MATAPTAPLPLQPPVNAPVSTDQDMTQAWLAHQQGVADVLNANTQTIADFMANGGIGVTDGSDVAAGRVGEYLSAFLGPTALPGTTLVDVGTLALPAGDWDVWGEVLFTATGTGMTGIQAWVNTVSATAPLNLGRSTLIMQTGVIQSGSRLVTGLLRVSLAAAAPVYLGAWCDYSGGGSVSGSGQIAARRAR